MDLEKIKQDLVNAVETVVDDTDLYTGKVSVYTYQGMVQLRLDKGLYAFFISNDKQFIVKEDMPFEEVSKKFFHVTVYLGGETSFVPSGHDAFKQNSKPSIEIGKIDISEIVLKYLNLREKVLDDTFNNKITELKQKANNYFGKNG